MGAGQAYRPAASPNMQVHSPRKRQVNGPRGAQDPEEALTELQCRAKGATKTAAHIPLEARCPFLHSQRHSVATFS